MNRDPGRPLGPADLERLDAALAPTDADVERHVRVALARSSGPVRRVPIRVIAGLAAVAVGVIAVGAVAVRWVAPAPVTIAATAGWQELGPGMSVSGDGAGVLVDRRITWSGGRGVFSIEPGSYDPDAPLEVITDDARVRVTGTVFAVDRRGYGTSVEVSRGSVEVICASGTRHRVGADEAAVCAPDAASALAMATELAATDHPPAVVSAAIDAGLAAPDAARPVAQSLAALAVRTQLRAGRIAAAAQAARDLDPSFAPARGALRSLADAVDGCDPAALVGVRAVADEPGYAVRLAGCVEDPREAVRILERARESASEADRATLDRWIAAFAERGP